MEKLELKGIQRFKDAINTNPEGSCDEIINLRRKDGQWVLIYQKDEEYDLTGIADLVLYIDWYKHPVTDDSWFIAVMNHAFAAQTIELVKASVPSSTTILTLDLYETVTKVYHFGYFLIVATNNNVHYLKYDRDTDTYVVMPDLEHGLYSFSTEYDPVFNPDTSREAALITGESSDTMSEMLTKMRNKINKLEAEGKFNGHVYFRVAFRLVDGNVIMPTVPYYAYIGLPYFDGTAPNVQGDFDNTPNIEITIATSSKLGSWRYFGMPNFYVGLTAAQEAILDLYDGLVNSIVVYMSKPMMDRDHLITDEPELEEVSLGSATHTQYVFPMNNSVPKYLEEIPTFYEIQDISIPELIIGNSIVINAGDLNAIETRRTLPVDSFSAHKIFSNILYDYNNRLHIANPLVKLGEGYNASIKDNLSTAVGVPEQLKLLINLTDPVYVGETTTLGTIYSIVTLNINNKERVVIKEHDKIAVYKDGAAGVLMYMVVNSLLFYPDSRAISIQYVVLDGGVYYDISGVKRLKPHIYLNLAYQYPQPTDFENALNDNLGLRTFQYKLFQLIKGSVVTVAVDNVYNDTNRIQASSTGNFLHYPADNSYRIGKTTNQIVGIMSQSVPMSQGQYGVFPLMVFTTEGIFSLEQGSGDILYQSTQPVSLDVCNNTDSVIPINGGILFASEKGLMVLYGRKVDEISVQVEGDPKVDINADANFISAMDGSDGVVSLSASVSTVGFVTYLSGAIIAYDHKNAEIIISNDTYSYSYIFSILGQVWYKTDQVFSNFITNHPNWSGIIGSKIYNLSDEDTTVYPDFMIKTNPFKFGVNVLKTIERLALRFNVDNSAYIRGNNFTSLYLYGSLDGKVWSLISGVMPDHTSTQMDQNFLMLRKVRTTARYFILFIASSSAEITISDLEFDVKVKIAKKLR